MQNFNIESYEKLGLYKEDLAKNLPATDLMYSIMNHPYYWDLSKYSFLESINTTTQMKNKYINEILFSLVEEAKKLSADKTNTPSVFEYGKTRGGRICRAR